MMETERFLSRLFFAAKAAGLDRCEAYCVDGEEFEATIREGAIDSYSVSRTLGIGFRALVGGRLGYASTQAPDEESVGLLIDSARRNAALIESADEQFLFDGDAEYPDLRMESEAARKADAGAKIRLLRDLEAEALRQDERIRRLGDCGVFSTSFTRLLRNSAGLSLSFSDAYLGMYLSPVAQHESRSYAATRFDCARDIALLNVSALARRAADESLSGLLAAPIPSGEMAVVLRNDAASALLRAFSGAFSADAAQKGLSLLKGREGETIASRAVTLMDDPLLAGGRASRSFDGEGVPARTKAVLEGGRLTTLLHNLKTANKQGVKSTGNAARASYASPIGVSASNFYFAPGAQKREELIERAGSGLFVTELQGLHAGANAVSGDFSLAARGFVIENGRLGRAVNGVTVAGNFFSLLKKIEAAADDLYFSLPGFLCCGSPSLLVCELSVAGSAGE